MRQILPFRSHDQSSCVWILEDVKRGLNIDYWRKNDLLDWSTLILIGNKTHTRSCFGADEEQGCESSDAEQCVFA